MIEAIYTIDIPVELWYNNRVLQDTENNIKSTVSRPFVHVLQDQKHKRP